MVVQYTGRGSAIASLGHLERDWSCSSKACVNASELFLPVILCRPLTFCRACDIFRTDVS
jgi:hypothetical protein